MHFTHSILAVAAVFASVASAAPTPENHADLLKRVCPTLRSRGFENAATILEARDVELIARGNCFPWKHAASEAEDAELQKRVCPSLRRRGFETASTTLEARDVELIARGNCFPWRHTPSEAEDAENA